MPRAIAVASWVLLAVLALAYPDKLREPDPYAYRAAIEAIEQGDLTLTAEQYAALDARLRAEGDGWDRPSATGTGRAAAAGCGAPGSAANRGGGAAVPGGAAGPAGPGVAGGPGGAAAGPPPGVTLPPGVSIPPGGAPPGAGAPGVGAPGATPGGASRGPGGLGAGPGSGGPGGGGTGLGFGIAQWVRTPAGACASEKNPGYPFLAVPFDLLGLVRLAPLVYGALGCLGLWFAGRRWLGAWGGAFAVGLFCSPAAMLIMANRATMPSFTDAALLAAGGGTFVWVVLAIEARWARRVVVGAAAALALGAAVTVRYTNLVAVAVVAGWVVLAVLRRRWALGWRALVPWAVAGAVPLVLAGLYDRIVFGAWLAVGYEQAGGLPTFTLANAGPNLRVMPARLVAGWPAWVLAAAALVVAGVAAVVRRARRRPPSPTATEDRWVLPLLAGWWAVVWGLYLTFAWTWQSVPDGGHFIITVRFYLPAAGAVALLGAWLVVRVPRVVGVAALVVLFVVGGLSYRAAVTSGAMFSAVGAGPSGGGPAGAGPNGGGPAGPSGSRPNGAGPNEAGPNGAGPNGAGPNGVGPNGAGPNGVGPNGAGLNGAGPNGAGPNGLGG